MSDATNKFGKAITLGESQGEKEFREKPDTQYDKLKLLSDYTKFHIGLYTGVVAAFLGIAKLGEANFSSAHMMLLFVSIICICLAGGCGGVVASNIAELETASFRVFWNRPIGILNLNITKMRTEQWSQYEHVFFWFGVILGLFNFGMYFFMTR